MGFEWQDSDKPNSTCATDSCATPCRIEPHSKSKDPHGTYSTGNKFSPYANEMLKMFFFSSEVLVLLMQGAQTS